MGTGKSAVGRLLARKLKRPFVDLDARISKEAKRSVPQLFAVEGEPGFRKRESEAVECVSDLKGHVIATGGGVMLNESNVRALKRNGTLICLTASVEVILQRTFTSLPSRPLLNGPDPRGRIEELLRLRAPYYARADWTIDTSGRSIQEVADEILKGISDCGVRK